MNYLILNLNLNLSLPACCSGSRRRLDWPHGASSNRSVRAVDKLGPLASLLRNNCDASGRADAKLLADLLRGMLRYDPAQRPSARACLRHEFFQVGLGFRVYGVGFRVYGLAMTPPRGRQRAPACATSGSRWVEGF